MRYLVTWECSYEDGDFDTEEGVDPKISVAEYALQRIVAGAQERLARIRDGKEPDELLPLCFTVDDGDTSETFSVDLAYQPPIVMAK